MMKTIFSRDKSNLKSSKFADYNANVLFKIKLLSERHKKLKIPTTFTTRKNEIKKIPTKQALNIAD